MDIGKAFRFVFEDPEWVAKVLIGGIMALLTPLIIGALFLLGYSVELVQNVRAGAEQPLPRWDDLGGKAGKGLKLGIVFLIWSLPILVLTILLILLMLAAGEDETAILALSLCFGSLTLLWSLVLAFATPAIVIHFAETEQIGAGLQVGRILSFTLNHIGEVLIAVLISWVAGLVAGLVGTLLCGIGLLFTGFWASMVQYHLYGQIGRRAEAAMPEATA